MNVIFEKRGDEPYVRSPEIHQELTNPLGKGHKKKMRRLSNSLFAIAGRNASSNSNNNTSTKPSTSHVLTSRRAVEETYNKWSGEERQCNCDDLLRGAKQAYLDLGAVLDAASKVPKSALEQGLKKYLSSQAALEESMATESATDTAAPSSSPTASLDATSDAFNKQQLDLDTLPMGESLRRMVAKSLKQSVEGKLNPFQLAHPADYVISAQIQSFQAYDAEHKSTKTVMSVEEVVTKPNQDGTKETVIQSTTVETSSTELPLPQEKGTHAAANQNAGPLAEDVCDKRVTISTNQTRIPRSAKAFVVVCLHVVAPPRRFYSHYNWFYDRIEGHENDHERIAMATIFSSSSAIGVMKFFDRAVKLFSGSPAGFQCTRTLLSMLRLPENMLNCPPCRKKYIGLYLSKHGEWILAEVMNSVDVFDLVVPSSLSE